MSRSSSVKRASAATAPSTDAFPPRRCSRSQRSSTTPEAPRRRASSPSRRASTFANIAARQRRIVEEIARDDRDERFEQRGIAVVRGEGRFLSPRELAVDGEPLRGKRFVIATGSEPTVPPLPGIENVPYLTNRTIFDLERLPKRLLVLGASATGLELAQAFRRFGSEVVVIELLERLLPAEEPDAGRILADVFRHESIDLRLGAQARAAGVDGVEVVLSLEREELRGDALLLAVGRRGSIDGLGLEALGVALDGGYIDVDRRGRTSVTNIFAAGDVTGGLQFTHVAAHEGRVAGRASRSGRSAS